MKRIIDTLVMRLINRKIITQDQIPGIFPTWINVPDVSAHTLLFQKAKKQKIAKKNFKKGVEIKKRGDQNMNNDEISI